MCAWYTASTNRGIFMAIFDFLSDLFGSHVQDITQNIPGVDALNDAGQTVSDAAAGVTDAAQNAASGVTEQVGNVTDKLPKL